MRAEIISIGDELTSGQRLDTNSQWLAERLLEIGVPVAFHTTVGDVLDDNVLAFRQACERADIVVMSGGLGPTADDLTRHALAKLAGVPLVQDDASLAHIKALFARRKREMPPANEVQALFPQGSRPIPNPHGSAPGIEMTISAGGQPARVFALPGVPAEMKEMWQASVAPALQNLLGVKRTIAHYRIKCFGVGESDLEAMLPDLIARQRYPLVGITVHQATITLRITAEGETYEAARAAMQSTIETIQKCLGDLIFGYEDTELQDIVVRLLREQKKTMAVIEYGTQGLVSHWLAQTEFPEAVKAGIVCNDPAFWIDEIRGEHSGADYILHIGPIPGINDSTQQPDQVVVLLRHQGKVIRRDFPLAAHPKIVRPRAAKQSLNLLRLHLLGKM